MHGRIGVVNRQTELGEHFRRLALAHADRAGQADKIGAFSRHGPAPLPDMRLSAGVTFGSTPKKAAKAGTAWCISMPNPSTVRRPRALAPSQKFRFERIIDGIEYCGVAGKRVERQIERRRALHAGAGRIDQQAHASPAA